jgi:hypothetical protein
MTDQDAVLVQILAATDAVWKPMRQADWATPTPTLLYEYRKRFASAGVPWHSGDPTEAGRKSNQRTLEGLASAGLVTLHGRERRAAVRLTEKGDILARALAGLGNVDAGHRSLYEVLELHDKMASELWLARLDDYADTDDCRVELLIVQRLIAPALWRGWVESGSDCHGRVWYWATDQGREVAKLPAPTLPDDLPSMDEAAAGVYDAEVIAYRQRLRYAKPDNSSELGFIPLSASIPLRPKSRVKMQTQ